MQAYQWAERYATQLQDTFRILNIWANKSDVYIHQKQIEKALALKEKTADELQRLGYRSEAAQTRGACIDWLAERGELQKAKAYIDDYEQHSGYFLKNGDIRPDLVSYYETKGFYYLKADRTDSAEYYYRKLAREAKTSDDRKGALWGLNQLYVKLNNNDSIAKYSYLYNLEENDTQYEQSRKDYQKSQSMYNYDRQKQKAIQKENEIKNIWSNLRYALFAAIAVLTPLLAFLYKRHRKNEQAHDAAIKFYKEQDQKQNDAIASYQKKTQEQDDAIASLQKREQEQNDAIASYQKREQEQNDAIASLRKREQEQNDAIASYQKRTQEQDALIASYQEREHKAKNRLKEEQLFDEEIVLRITKIAEKPTVHASIEECRELEKTVEKYYPAMRKLMKCYNFNKVDYHICLLVKLHFRLKTIGTILNIDKNNISAKRRGMFKKITGKIGKTGEIDQYINRIALGSETLPEL